MTTVVLAEKPDQGRKFAKALGASGTSHTKGFIEINDCSLLNDHTIVTWCYLGNWAFSIFSRT